MKGVLINIGCDASSLALTVSRYTTYRYGYTLPYGMLHPQLAGASARRADVLMQHSVRALAHCCCMGTVWILRMRLFSHV